MNKIAFLVPIYMPHFKYAQNIIKTWKETELDKQADIWFIFTSEEEKEKFIEWNNSIVLPQNLRIFDNNGIINIKKLYGVKQLKDKYEYIIVLDSESEFIKNVNLTEICEDYFARKELYGNLVYSEGKEMTERIKNSCKEYFEKYNTQLLDTDFYLWFNQPCIYKTAHLDDFLQKINYEDNITKLRWDDFDYYLYMYYLILFNNFKIVDSGIESASGFCEADEAFLTFKNDNYVKLKIYMCSKIIANTFDNPNLFILIHVDRDASWISKVLNIKIVNLQRTIEFLEERIKSLENNEEDKKKRILKNYLKNINFDSQYKKLIKKYKNDKIVIYGAGQLFRLINEMYDLSKLNIIGICDRSFDETDEEKQFLGYNKILVKNLSECDANIILLGALEYWNVIKYLKKNVFKTKRKPIKPIAYKPFKIFLREMICGKEQY